MKVLRKNSVGYPFPYTEVLANREDMIVSDMTKEELLLVLNSLKPKENIPEIKPQEVPAELILKDKKDECPGKGWVRNKKGKWVRRATKNVAKADKPSEASPETEV